MNNINMMRLVLASAVIVGHAPEMINGNRTREPLAQIAPYASLGSVAVSGFFLLSGYLIVKSMLRENALLPYLRRRIVRIVPGFLAAYLLSFLVLAPLLGLSIRPRLHEAAWNMLFFKAVPVFPELAMPYPSVNGAIWTIAYEFRCYLLVALLWATGLLKMPRFMVSLTALLLTLNIAIGSYQVTSFLDQGRNVRWVDLLFGPMTEEIGFVGTLLLGPCFFLYRDRLSPYLTWKMALTSAALALLAFRSEHLQFFARAALLAFPIFWMALKANVGVLQRLNGRWDISYGTYLYGWPIAITILFFYRGVSPLALALTALPLAWLAGLASWVLVENAAGQVANRFSSPNRAI